MIELLITLLVVAVLVYVVYLVLGMLHLPPPIQTIVFLIVGLVVLLFLLDMFGLYNVR